MRKRTTKPSEKTDEPVLTMDEFQKIVGAMMRGSEKFDRPKSEKPEKSDSKSGNGR